MAKISARGDTQRWRFRNEDGAELVYTSRGRLLLKAIRGGSFTLLVPNASETTVLDEAARREMETVGTGPQPMRRAPAMPMPTMATECRHEMREDALQGGEL